MLDYSNNQNLQKMNKIQNRLSIIKPKMEKHNDPIFIELVGTPKSGKTTLKNALTQLFQNQGIDIITRQETAEYNPIEKDSKQYDMWMILELFKNISEDLSRKTGQVIIYDRGILDRLPWMQWDILNNRMSNKDYERVLGLYDMNMFDQYRPITKIFKTSPELSIMRKGKSGKFVNHQSISQYNILLDRQLPTISELSNYSTIIQTDDYQGDIQRFILDNTIDILLGMEKVLGILERENIR